METSELSARWSKFVAASRCWVFCRGFRRSIRCSILVSDLHECRSHLTSVPAMVQAFQPPRSVNRHDPRCRGARADRVASTSMKSVLRYLRIAWTVFCTVACVLLIALWCEVIGTTCSFYTERILPKRVSSPLRGKRILANSRCHHLFLVKSWDGHHRHTTLVRFPDATHPSRLRRLYGKQIGKRFICLIGR
jgi:hypothetical protein